jgi:ribosome-binding factor A
MTGLPAFAGNDEKTIELKMTRAKKPRDAGPQASQRQLRVGELVRHAVAELLTRGDVHDDVIASHMITVPEVKMSADMRLATVYIMPLG